MRRVAFLLCLLLILVVSSRWNGQAQQPQPSDDHFTGKSVNMDAKDLSIGRRSFEPGARAAWHSHDKGQLLYVERGRARVQRQGEPVKELAQGETDYTAPNVVHWHGAVPDQAYVQIAVGFGGDIKWLQKVTDEEYGKRK